jgi:hypothetical protein
VTDYSDIRDRFQRETAGHEMTVLHDDGLYRHLRFRKPEHGDIYRFDLVTWPGHLTVCGDINDAYTFSRVPDMFEFFRGTPGRINPHYWSQKLTGDRDHVMSYDEDLFNRRVAEELKEAEEEFPGVTAAWESATGDVLPDFYTSTEDEARDALTKFEFGTVFKASCPCGVGEEFTSDTDSLVWSSRHFRENGPGHLTEQKRVEGFSFEDSWEWDLRGFDWSFLWACFGIVWGIAQYDASRSPELAPAGGEVR